MKGELCVHKQGCTCPDHKEMQGNVVNYGNPEWSRMMRPPGEVVHSRIRGNYNSEVQSNKKKYKW